MRVSGVFEFQVEFVKNNLRLEIGGGGMSLVCGSLDNWIGFWYEGFNWKISTFNLE